MSELTSLTLSLTKNAEKVEVYLTGEVDGVEESLQVHDIDVEFMKVFLRDCYKGLNHVAMLARSVEESRKEIKS